jgi:hypothetical protein
MKRSYAIAAFWSVLVSPALFAQFSSGSTGSDGALNLTTAGTVVFDPVAMGLDPAGDNIFNFTTINIGPSTTVVMTANLVRNNSVIWLATGTVTISGTINLAGANGAAMAAANPGATRSPAEPGPGGFPGGVGAYLSSPATAGGGYGGGVAGSTNNGGSGSYLYNSLQLVPLVGGAGGGGAGLSGSTAGCNGGAGGGAIRIVSSTSISLTGNIYAYGGTGFSGTCAHEGGSGTGGAVHLIAPTVSGNGKIDVEGNTGNAGSGVVKISATTNTFAGTVTTASGSYTTVPLYAPPLPTGAASVKVVSVNGIPAPTEVTGSSLVPDFTVSTANPVTVNIAAQNIPIGTVVNLYLNSEQGNDSLVACAPLAGTLASSTASCTGATYPQGVSITYIKAVW